MLPPKSQYQVQRTVVPTKYPGKDQEDSSGGPRITTKGRTVRFRSVCEEFDVKPSRESSPVCEVDRETLPGKMLSRVKLCFIQCFSHISFLVTLIPLYLMQVKKLK